MELTPDTIIDCHLHFLDEQVHHYPVFQQRSPALESLVGDYSALPRSYHPEDYWKDTKGFHVVKTVCAEFISGSPMKEAQWAQNLSAHGDHPSGVIALADFTSSDIESVVNQYGSMERVRAVRQHLAWHPTNPFLRSAPQPHLLSEVRFRKGVALLSQYNLCCEIEIFAHQLTDFAALANSCPDVRFVLPLMGWPLDLSQEGYQTWKSDMTALSNCKNVAVKVFGMECIFGLRWTVQQIRPWILETIASFGPNRCMFASHMPLTLLTCSFQELYGAYLDVVSEFSLPEKRQLFHDTAAHVYKL